MTPYPKLEVVGARVAMATRSVDSSAATTAAPADDLLMLAAASGDTQAFATLVTRYEAQVRGFCRVILGDESRARDAAQDVFLRLWQARSRYEARGRFREWLFTAAKNLCRTQQRRHAFRRLFMSEEPPPAEPPAHDPVSPEGEVAQVEESRLLQAALQKLDEKFRVPLVLRYFSGLEYDEISKVIGRTPSAARSRVFYGLKRMAEIMAGEVMP